jgi:hypothetical protein
MATPQIPEGFEGFTTLEGLDQIDKAELVGKPFGIMAVRLRTNERDIMFAEVEVVTVDGETWVFSDSSTTGVRDQLLKVLEAQGHEISADTDWYEVKLFVPSGLRVSAYEVEDHGKTKKAKTYYLTSGGRGTSATAEKVKAHRQRSGAKLAASASYGKTGETAK